MPTEGGRSAASEPVGSLSRRNGRRVGSGVCNPEQPGESVMRYRPKSSHDRSPEIREECAVNLVVLLIILLLVFGGGGFYVGGPAVGGSLGGIILLVLIVLLVTGRL
jgi:hypothetical protein